MNLHGSPKLHVFLCHSAGDKEQVRSLYNRLTKDGIAPWFDEENLRPGQNWRYEIERAVSASDAVIVCLSRSSITKEGFVQREIRLALDAADEKPENTIFIIPVKLEKCTAPDRLARWQWVNLFEPDGYRKLLGALQERGRSLGLHVSPAIRCKKGCRDDLEYVWVPSGMFIMGAGNNDPHGQDDERPQHPIKVTKNFWIGRTPVTVAAYRQFADETGASMPPPPVFDINWEGKNNPIVNVSWHAAQTFCRWAGTRLPTEAEWEYAVQLGSERINIHPFDEQSYLSSTTKPVGNDAPSIIGLHDIHGNVSQWIADWYDPKYYSRVADAVAADPQGPDTGTLRVIRGSSWYSNPMQARTSFRGNFGPDYGLNTIGFRCVLDE